MLCNITHKNNHKIKRNDHGKSITRCAEYLKYHMIVSTKLVLIGATYYNIFSSMVSLGKLKKTPNSLQRRVFICVTKISNPKIIS